MAGFDISGSTGAGGSNTGGGQSFNFSGLAGAADGSILQPPPGAVFNYGSGSASSGSAPNWVLLGGALIIGALIFWGLKK